VLGGCFPVSYRGSDQATGKMLQLSRDQWGCRFLQAKLDENPTYVTPILAELLENFAELMVGAHLIPSLFCLFQRSAKVFCYASESLLISMTESDFHCDVQIPLATTCVRRSSRRPRLLSAAPSSSKSCLLSSPSLTVRPHAMSISSSHHADCVFVRHARHTCGAEAD
jgi:hypothetical protein